MACELRQREIPNAAGELVLVGCRQLAASKALDLHIELIGKVGTEIFPFIENKYNFSDIIFLMKAGKDTKLTELIKRVCSEATLNGQTLQPTLFDSVFQNDLMLVYKVFAFVVETNFYDFFKEGLALNEQRRLEVAETSTQDEPQNSTQAQTSV